MLINGIVTRRGLTKLIVALSKLRTTDSVRINEVFIQMMTRKQLILNTGNAFDIERTSAPSDPKATFQILGEANEDEADWFLEHLEAEDWRSEDSDELGPQLLGNEVLHPTSAFPLAPKR
jgi:hypothetical protein